MNSRGRLTTPRPRQVREKRLVVRERESDSDTDERGFLEELQFCDVVLVELLFQGVEVLQVVGVQQ